MAPFFFAVDCRGSFVCFFFVFFIATAIGFGFGWPEAGVGEQKKKCKNGEPKKNPQNPKNETRKKNGADGAEFRQPIEVCSIQISVNKLLKKKRKKKRKKLTPAADSIFGDFRWPK